MLIMKKSHKILYGVSFGSLGFMIAVAVYVGVDCTQVKADYENNPELAREKYGYNSLEEWIENYPATFKEGCMPNVGDVRVLPGPG